MSILSKLTQYGKRFRKSGGTKRLNPARDWLMVLAIALLILIASVAWNAWFFFVGLNAESAPQQTSVQDKLDTSAIDKARVLFNARAAEEARYRAEYHFNDPSK